MKKKLLTKFWLALCCIFLSSNMYSTGINDFQGTVYDCNSKANLGKESNPMEVDGLLYWLDHQNKKATLQGVINKEELTEAVIPAIISIPRYNYNEEYQVTEIAIGAFNKCEKLTSITIPEGVTKIGKDAFKNCKSLANITIPQSVTIIENQVFSDTEWYKKTFPEDGLVYINSVAYSYKGEMPNDTTLSIKEGTVSIAGSAFYDCDNLTSISLPASLKRISMHAFLNCTKLSEIKLPENLEYIEEGAFATTSIKKITIPASVKYIGNSIVSYPEEIRFEGVTPPNNDRTNPPPYYERATYCVPLKSFAAYYRANLIPLGTNHDYPNIVRTVEDNTVIYAVTSQESTWSYAATITLNGEEESIIGIKAGENIEIMVRTPEVNSPEERVFLIEEFQINNEEPIRMNTPRFSYCIKGASKNYVVKVRLKYLPLSAVSDGKVDAIRVYTSNGTLKIENAFETAPVTILNLAGQPVYQGTTDNYEAVSLPSGMYLVKVGTETHKVVIK